MIRTRNSFFKKRRLASSEKCVSLLCSGCSGCSGCSALQSIAEHCSAVRCIASLSPASAVGQESVGKCVVVRSALQCVGADELIGLSPASAIGQESFRVQPRGHRRSQVAGAVCCSVLQCVAVCCSVLQSEVQCTLDNWGSVL